MLVQQLGSGGLGPAAVLSQQRVPGRGRVVRRRAVGILQRGKLLFSRDLECNKVPSEHKVNV